MMCIKNILVCLIALLLSSCFATRECRSKFVNSALKNENALRSACSYILQNIRNEADVKVLELDSIKNAALRDSLKTLNIGTIYIHSKKVYDYAYPQDSSIAFSKSYNPLKTSKHELLVFSFSKSSDTLKSQDFKNVKEGTTFCRVKQDVFYYSY